MPKVLSLEDLILHDMKIALKNKDKLKLSTLRMIRAAIKNKEISKKEKLTEDEVLSIISNYLKKLEESLEIYSRAQRTEMVEKVKLEIKIIKNYLPQPLSEEEIVKIIEEVIEANAFKAEKDIGRLMKEVMPRLKSRADGRLINKKARELLMNSND